MSAKKRVSKKTPAKKAGAKKTAAKKAPAKKAPAKKAAVKQVATKQSPPKKAGAKRAVKKAAVGKKTAAKKAPAKKAPLPPAEAQASPKKAAKKTSTRKRAATKAAATGAPAPEREAALRGAKRSPKETPSIFKPRKATTFTLDDVREVLKLREKESPAVAAKKANAKKATAKIEASTEVPSQNRVLGVASLDDILGIAQTPGSGGQGGGIPRKFKRYHELLLDLRAHVLEDLDTHTKETLKRSSKEDSGDLSSFSSHMADNGTDAFDRDFALSLVSSEQEALAEIEAAIGRVHDGTYGICEITGKPIAKERLEAVPFTRFSVEGQIEYERTARRRSQRGGAYLDAGDDVPGFSDEDSDE